MSKGIKKINEYTIVDGRALLATQDLTNNSTDIQWDNIENGTIFIDPVTGRMKYKNKYKNIDENGKKVWTDFEPGNLIRTESITSKYIAPFEIKEGLMANLSISTRTLEDECVTSEKIARESLEAKHFRDNNMTGSIIMDGTLDGAKIIENSLNANRLRDRTVTNTKLAYKGITDKELADHCILSEHLGPNSITNFAIANKTIEAEKLAGGITSEKLADGAVINSKINEKAVDWRNINDLAIKTNHITDGCITNNKLSEDCIEGQNIISGAIENKHLAENSVGKNNIQAGVIGLDKLDTATSTKISNSVIHENGTARVYGNLQVDNNIKATQANYTQTIEGFTIVNQKAADFAEAFVVSEPMEEGDIVEIDKCGCVQKAKYHSKKAIGVVSNRYGMCLDASREELESGAKTPIGLIGKLPINVVGIVFPGDYIISNGDGTGIATSTYEPGLVVARALEEKMTFKKGKVLCLIQCM